MRIVVLSIALLLCCNPAIAQEESKFHFLLNGGVTIPMAPDVFDEVWRTGVNLGGGVSYHLTSRFSLLGRVNYDQFPTSDQELVEFLSEELGIAPSYFNYFDIYGAEVSNVSVSGELKASLFGRSETISPYLIGGFGVAHVSTHDTIISALYYEMAETIEGESETAACVTFGGGVDVPLAGRFAIFIEGRYQMSFTDEERTDHSTFAAGLRVSVW